MIHFKLMGAWVLHETLLWGRGSRPPQGSCAGGVAGSHPQPGCHAPCTAEQHGTAGTRHCIAQSCTPAVAGTARRCDGTWSSTFGSRCNSSLSFPLSPTNGGHMELLFSGQQFRMSLCNLAFASDPWACLGGISPSTRSSLNALYLPLCHYTETCKPSTCEGHDCKVFVIYELCAIVKFKLAFQILIHPLIEHIGTLEMTRKEH